MEDKTHQNPDTYKPYELSFEYRPEYLYAYVTGEEDSYEISKQFWLEIAAECKRSDVKKVLIEEYGPVRNCPVHACR